MFSSSSIEWETPPELFAYLDRQHHFDLDPCCRKETAKCEHYFTPNENGLFQEWYGTVYMNPPYGREIKKWLTKAYSEVRVGRAKKVVCLIPSRTSTSWWHDYVMYARELILIEGRLKFRKWTDTEEGYRELTDSNSAPFPSAICIFEGEMKEIAQLKRIHRDNMF
jgi:site-specific DNA-methyltransferase (adenine-specific)